MFLQNLNSLKIKYLMNDLMKKNDVYFKFNMMLMRINLNTILYKNSF